MERNDNLTNTLQQKDRENVWHHISMYNEKAPPMIVEHGEGAWITDSAGNRFLDGMSGLWAVNVGYGRERLAQVAYEQMKKLCYVPMTQSHQPAIALAEKMNQLLEDDYMIFYSNSGSDANEVAFKMARQYHNQNGEGARFKIISRYRAYHGSSLGALAATGQALRKYKYEPLAPGFLHVAPPDNYRRPKGQSIELYNLERAREIEEKIIWEQKETIAAVIMEPIITGGGVLIPHPSYVKEVERICQKYGVLLIIDEVICGFGRTGRLFGHQHFAIKPDIITMAKGLTSAYLPLSITAVRKDIYEKFKDTDGYSHFRHVNTFGGNPAACAVALENIKILEEEKLVQRSKDLGEQLLHDLQDLLELPFVGDIRGLGFLVGIELVEDKLTLEPAKSERLAKIIADCKANGLVIGKNGDTVEGFNNILTLSPPLCCTDEDLEFISAVLKKVFAANA
ncbi:aspartate aminotransferase family protein [Lysinibacillus sphaericus]|uniref:Aminotransferase n=1 Tax=Lysinibacillus sphaericus OT4b.31 TaxID=1285586 RepID=R7ZEW5_LYSSH|nr:aspartate aminotransferase family protein [Lysinibacillus sphaericus]EON72623.1 aminotransferase [Lysinibacillus sphaericus OT4b.31]